MSFAGAEHIIASLEIAAERKGDLSNDVYARLFAQFPDTEPLFVMDRDGQVRGAMLTHVFDTIFDFIGERRYAHRFIASEIITHDGYNVPPDAFAAFFGIVRDEVRAACGAHWSADMNEAWLRLLIDLDHCIARLGQANA
jgi:hemoglobin-like flavoprotein